MRGKVARYASALILLLGFAAHAKTDSDITTPPSTQVATTIQKITSKDVEAMPIEQLQQLYADLSARAAKLHTSDLQPSDPALEVPIINEMAKYEIYEPIYWVQARLWAEVLKEERLMSHEIIEACLNTLTSTLVLNPPALMDHMGRILETAEKAMTTRDGKQLVDYAAQVLDRAKARGGFAYSLEDVIARIGNTPRQLSADLKKMEAFLKKRILGQPEVVDALMALEWNNQLFKNARMAPDVIYLMGLPGTGKDTAAEAFTDALWKEDNSYEKHMFRLTLKDKPELWQALGSATGYIGSDAFPPFLEFLVNHSGGRYILQQAQAPGQKPSFSIIENPNWKGVNLEGFATPDKAVVFANEFHNWSKDNKDVLMKQALEKGYFKVNNPNGGVSEIYVPVRFVIASNEGIPLITAREANGERFGKPLDYDQIDRKWQRVHNDKEALKGEILSHNGDKNSKPMNGSDALGTSEELLNRIPSRFILLLRPLSPDALKEVVNSLMKSVQKSLSKESGFFKSVDLSWDQSLTDFVQSYDYVAENNARPIKGNMQSLIVETLTKALRDGDLPVNFNKHDVKLKLSITNNTDNTANLVIGYEDEDHQAHEVTKLIEVTEKDRPAAPLTAERIEHLKTLAERLKKRVFGIDVIADRLADRVLAIENQRTADSEESRKVSVLVALGLSSTGKTELAKALSYELTGEEGNLVTFDFSQIQTLHDFQTRILGVRNGQSSVASDFMKAYDRAGGKMIVAFDELANVKDQNLLTALYDFFREPIISTFSDGKPRKMGAVMVLVTGNAGQELYKNVPREAPMAQQMAAWEEISKRTASDPELQRQVLERYFPEPLVNRFGKNNIFFFPPHTYRTLKQLVQLKLSKQFKRLADTKSKHGWNVVLPSVQDYNELVETIVNEGFSLRYQGASVDSYVTEDFSESLESLLLRENVASGSTVVVKMVGKTVNDDEDHRGQVHYKVYVDGRAPIDFAMNRAFEPIQVNPNLEKQMITGYHEAGHSLIAEALFPDIYKAGMISIIPGVTQIGEDWVMYLGIASHLPKGTDHTDRLYFAKQIAILAAGETAERLVTKGVHTAGKSNDMERATKLAQDAILRYGLSEAWGVNSIPSGVKLEDYLASLSNEKKLLLEKEVNALLKEGRDMAEKYLKLNFDQFVNLGNVLIENGIRTKEEMQAFYVETKIVHYGEEGSAPGPLATLKNKFKEWMGPGKKIDNNFKPKRLRDDIQLARHVANIDEIVESRKLEQYASVAPPETAPVGTNDAYNQSAATHVVSSCELGLSGL